MNCFQVCVFFSENILHSHHNLLLHHHYLTLHSSLLTVDWRNDKENGPPIHTKAKDDSFLVLTGSTGSMKIPYVLLPPELHNDGNYIISLSQLVRWLAGKAEELGVEIYPGT